MEAKGVHDRLGAAARAVRGAHVLDERGRRVRLASVFGLSTPACESAPPNTSFAGETAFSAS